MLADSSNLCDRRLDCWNPNRAALAQAALLG